MHQRDGSHEHREYLHVDARRPAARAGGRRCSPDLGDTGSIAHYTSYERVRLDGARSRRARARRRDRRGASAPVDLAPIISRNTLHPDAAGRTSIKYVLPAWCPDLSYSELAIGDGQTASTRYLHAITGRIDEAEAQTVFADLREYCELDTYAMVRLLEVMRELAASA